MARPEPEAAGGGRDLLILALLAPLVGVATGLLCAFFRLALVEADRLRNVMLGWAQGYGIIGLPAAMTLSALAALCAAWLVRRYAPLASGSGIPHVEAVLAEELPPAPLRLLPVKFFGGLLAIGGGLMLGREGPSVQMGAGVGQLIGTAFRRGWPDCRVLIAAGAGAGLATAFNAPIAGAIFVIEELVRRFETRMAIVALGAAGSAISAAIVLRGNAPEFQSIAQASAGLLEKPLFLVLGALCGAMAVFYNRTLIATMAAADRLKGVPVELRAAAIGAAVGALGWFAPALIGGGDPLTQQALDGAGSLNVLAAIFVVRLALGALSYAAGTPGGLFAPMMVLGAEIGLAFGIVCHWLFPALVFSPGGFAVVGMAAFFTGVVRAPLTGIVLVLEMTADVGMLLPMLVACFAAMLVPTLARDPPIYETLRGRTIGAAGGPAKSASAR